MPAPWPLCLLFAVVSFSILTLSQFDPAIGPYFPVEILVGMLFLAFYYPSTNKDPFGWVRIHPLHVLAFGIIGGAANQGVENVVGIMVQIVASYFSYPLAEENAVQQFRGTHGISELLTTLGMATLFIPFCEELFFRGFVYATFRKFVGPWRAIIYSGLIFGFAHLNVYAFVPLSLLGMALALAYEMTGSLAVPVAIHGFFNLYSCLELIRESMENGSG